MNSIKEVELINFQSHKHSKLNFAEGLNVITGPSDQGKSAIIRALRWVLYNEPGGTDFITMGFNECQVKLKLQNGFEIIRKRNKTENRYIIVDNTGERKIYEKIGRDVPQEIVDLHGMPKISWDTDSKVTLNLDYQLDGAFLLKDSSYTRAKILGRLSRVHIVDSAIRDTINDISDLKRRRRSAKENIAGIDEKLEDFSDLKQLEKEINQGKKVLNKLKEVTNRLKSLKGIKSDLDSIDGRIKKVTMLLNNLKQLDKLKRLQKRIIELESKYSEFKRMKETHHSNQKQLNKTKELLTKTAQVTEAKDKINILKEKSKTYNNLQEIAKKKNENQKQIIRKQKIINKTSDNKKIKAIINQVGTKLARAIDLNSLKDKFKNISQKLTKEKNTYRRFSQLKQVEKLKEKVANKIELLDELQALAEKKEDTETRINKGRAYIKKNEQQLANLLARYNKLLKQIGKCPICFSEIKEATINEIINNYRREE